MDCEKCDVTGNGDGQAADQAPHKPDTTLEMEIDELMSSSSADEATVPPIIIVETCLTEKRLAQQYSELKEQKKEASQQQQEQLTDRSSALTMTDQAPGCSSNMLRLKPNLAVAFHPLADQLCAHPLGLTEAALAAATSSAAAVVLAAETEAAAQSTTTFVDGTTQCTSVEYESAAAASSESMPSIGSLVCRICHNADNPEQLVSPCLCKGSLTYVHIHCLERWISTSRCTTCELCQFQYNTEQTLRYTCLQSLRLWYSRALSRRVLQEDCQMFSLLTLVAFGIIGTLLVGIQYYALHTQSWGLSKLWTRSWMLFFLFMTITVYFANVYMLIKSQLTPWYRWWQSARDIKLILENRRPFPNPSRVPDTASTTASMFTHHDQLDMQQQRLGGLLATPTSSQTELSKATPTLASVPNSAMVAIELALQGPARGQLMGDCKSQRTPCPLPTTLPAPPPPPPQPAIAVANADSDKDVSEGNNNSNNTSENNNSNNNGDLSV